MLSALPSSTPPSSLSLALQISRESNFESRTMNSKHAPRAHTGGLFYSRPLSAHALMSEKGTEPDIELRCVNVAESGLIS